MAYGGYGFPPFTIRNVPKIQLARHCSPRERFFVPHLIVDCFFIYTTYQIELVCVFVSV